MPTVASQTTQSQPSPSPSTSAPRTPWDVSRFVPASSRPDDVFVQVYCPETPIPPIPHSLTPPPATPLPPIIYHILAPHGLTATQPPTIIDFLATHTCLPRSLLHELAALGALYLRAGVPNARTSPRATRLTADTVGATLPPGVQIYIRAYASPKRHVARSPLSVLRIVGDVVAVHKPKGIPVASTADNAAECVTTLAATMLGVEKVHVTSRLDACTGGVLLLGLSTAGAKSANRMLCGKDCTKIYAVDTSAEPEVGVLRHWYNKKARLGRGVVTAPLLRNYDDGESCGEGWVVAELIVEAVNRTNEGWTSEVRLVTGRTHQIRMQFAAKGWLVTGDCKYAPVNGGVLDACEKQRRLGPDAEAIGLTATRTEGLLNGESVLFEVKSVDRTPRI